MNDSEIAQRLRERNVWWVDPDRWRRDDPYLREVAQAPIVYEPDPLAGIQPPGLYTLSGPRRVGKSVEVRRAIGRLLDDGVHPRQIIYASCEGMRERDLRRLFHVGRNLTRTVSGPRWWLIDEVTAVSTGWSSIVKDLRDDTALRDDCVVLTGSSARGFREATKNLAGRRGGAVRSTRLLLPMRFRDFCDCLGGELDDVPRTEPLRPRDMLTSDARTALEELSFWAEPLADAWEHYLHVGGFPRAIRDLVEAGDVRADFVHDLWDVVRGEVIKATSLSDADILRFLSRIGESLTTPLNATAVAKDVGLGNHHRVNDRINDLNVGFQTWKVHKLGNHGQAATNAPRKVYFLDPLLARLAHLRNSTNAEPDTTKLSEQQLGLALARRLEDEREQSFLAQDGILYERTPTDNEIDFVGPNLEIPFESKYVERNWRQQALTVEARYNRGILATRNILDLDHRAWAAPVATVVWILGA